MYIFFFFVKKGDIMPRRKIIVCNRYHSISFQYWDVNNSYGWEMSQKLSVYNFECIKDTFQFNEDFIKNYNEERDEGSFLKADIHYPEKLHDIHNNLPFLLERMKNEKVEKLVTNLHDKTEYFIYKKI